MYNKARPRRFTVFCVTMLVTAPLWAQMPQPPQGEPLSFVGMTLNELFERFGTPASVYTARGEENWQDDVVFVYNEGDFFIYRNRVWQIGLKSLYGMKIGDAKAVALLTLGDEAQDAGNYLLCNLSGFGWPLSLRVSLSDGKVSAIYVYRPDY